MRTIEQQMEQDYTCTQQLWYVWKQRWCFHTPLPPVNRSERRTMDVNAACGVGQGPSVTASEAGMLDSTGEVVARDATESVMR
jgi:hypothetical protein